VRVNKNLSDLKFLNDFINKIMAKSIFLKFIPLLLASAQSKKISACLYNPHSLRKNTSTELKTIQFIILSIIA